MATTLIPYQFSWDIRLRPYAPYDPSQKDLDIKWIEGTSHDGQVQEFDLADSDHWRELTIELTADLPRNVLSSLIPKQSDPENDTQLIVSLRCPTTKLRQAIPLDFVEPGRWRGSVSIYRNTVRSVVELHPGLVRRTTHPGSVTENVATTAGSLIAEGRTIRFIIDSTERPIKGAPKMVWVDFRVSGNTWISEHSADLFFLEPSGDEPILFLNSSYPEFREILHTKGSEGINSALRDLASSAVAQVVWTQLFLTAAAGVIVDDELGTIENPSGWRRGVLEGVLPRVLPECATQEERLRQIKEMLASPDEMGTLMARLGSVVQDVVSSGKQFQGALRAAERGER